MSEAERPDALDLYCGNCDVLSVRHSRDGDEWVCSTCGNVKECSNPQWSDNCTGDLSTVREARQGLCGGCVAVIESWSGGDEDRAEKSEQTTLMTDGGKAEGGSNPKSGGWPSDTRTAGNWHSWCADCGAKNHTKASECSACGAGGDGSSFLVKYKGNIGKSQYTSDGVAGVYDRSLRTETEQETTDE